MARHVIRRTAAIPAVIAVGALALAACSSSKSNSGSSGSPSASASAGPGGASGAKVPSKTIGILNITGASESTTVPLGVTKDALKRAGWKSIYIDAQGDPQKEAVGMTSLVNQKVDAIISIANQPAAIQSGLQAAKAAQIPVINIDGAIPATPLVAADYSVDEQALTSALDAYMLKHLPKSPSIATITAPVIYNVKFRDDAFTADVRSSAKVAANHALDFANPIQDASKAATDILTAHPDVSAFWTDVDFDVQPVAVVLKGKGKCGKVQLYGYYATLANIAAIRDGCGTAVVDAATAAGGYMAVDALLGYFVKRTPIPAKPPADQQFFAPTVVDKSNIPSDPSAHFPAPVDYVKFFTAKWQSAYGI